MVLDQVVESRTVRRFTGEPLLVSFDGGHSSGVGTAGYTVVGREGHICTGGEYKVGFTNNHVEILAGLHAL